MPYAIIRAIMAFANTSAGRRIIMYAAGKALEKVPELSGKFKISDEDMKDIKALRDRGAPFSMDEVALLSMAAGADSDGYALNEDDTADESVIDGYAKYLHNYLYNYKDEAAKIDSSIDPKQDQIGIMAQDLEKVNPACINTLPNGVKTVDTGRLALMNAGAIADLARRLDKIGG